MAGNSLDLYDGVPWWDHVPHFHGPGALTLVLAGAFGLAPLTAVGLATMLHVFLEVQEYYGDVVLRTHNVRGLADSMNDLAFGIAGVLVYAAIARWWMYLRRRRADPARRRSSP